MIAIKLASMRFQGVGWVIISALAVSAADGLLCDNRPQSHQAMECCRKEGSRFDAAKMDCCRPDRGENVPAERLSTTPSQMAFKLVATVAPALSRLGLEHQPDRSLIPSARPFPDADPYPSRAVPLLI